ALRIVEPFNSSCSHVISCAADVSRTTWFTVRPRLDTSTNDKLIVLAKNLELLTDGKILPDLRYLCKSNSGILTKSSKNEAGHFYLKHGKTST
ncbi:MAG: hypothetical protein ABI210_00035, partial [Abditibacteriaceae bacterium]